MIFEDFLFVFNTIHVGGCVQRTSVYFKTQRICSRICEPPATCSRTNQPPRRYPSRCRIAMAPKKLKMPKAWGKAKTKAKAKSTPVKNELRETPEEPL